MNIRSCKKCGCLYDRDKTRSYFCEQCKAVKAKEYKWNTALHTLTNAVRSPGRVIRCDICGKEFVARVNQIYCDDCRATRMSERYPKRKFPPERYYKDEHGKIILRGIACAQCGKVFDGPPRRKFCSKECKEAFQKIHKAMEKRQ